MEYKIWQKWSYLQNRSRLIDTENRLGVAKRGEGWSGKLLQIELTTRSYCIAQQPYSIPGDKTMETNIENNVYLGITESCCSTAEINKTL